MIKEIVFDLGGVYFEAGTETFKDKLVSMVRASKEIVDEIFESYPHNYTFALFDYTFALFLDSCSHGVFESGGKDMLKMGNPLAMRFTETSGNRTNEKCKSIVFE